MCSYIEQNVKKEMPSKPQKSLMSAIILKNFKQTIKESFVKLSHKNKGKVKLVQHNKQFDNSEPIEQICSLN